METIIIGMLFILFEGIFFSTMVDIPVKTRNKIFAILAFLQLFLVAGLRHVDVYNDSLTYAMHFESIDYGDIFSVDILERFEGGYQIFEKFIFHTISKDPTVLFLITSFLIQASYIMFFYRYSKVLWFSVFLYLGLTHYFFVVSGIRQGLAIAIFNFAIIFLFRKKWIWYSLTVILSAQFHSSAYILLLIPLFSKINFSKKTLIVFFMAMVLSFLYLDKILDAFFAFFPTYGVDYLEKDMISESKTGLYLIIITFAIGLLTVLKNFDFKNADDSEKFMLIFYLILLTFLFLSIKISILIRFTYYFIPLSIIMLSNSCSKIKNVENRGLVYIFWVIFLTLQVITILEYRPEWFTVAPYKFYWES